MEIFSNYDPGFTSISYHIIENEIHDYYLRHEIQNELRQFMEKKLKETISKKNQILVL